MRILNTPTYEAFRKKLLYDIKISFCTREHFGTPLPGEIKKNVRFAFSGISCEDIETACNILHDYMVAKETEFRQLPRIFCTRRIPEKGLQMLNNRVTLDLWEDEAGPSKDVLLEKAKECDGLLTLLTDKIDAELLSQCPNLKIISQMAVGYNNIDVAYCTKRGIAVTNTPDCLSETTAELTTALVFAVSRRVVEADKYVRDLKWKIEWHPSMFLGQDIHNHVYGIVGFGRIGQRVAMMMKTFGARVVYFDIIRKEELEGSMGVEYMPLEQLIQNSDFISVHCNLTKETHFLFDTEKIAMMKPNCIFVNTARGAIVDQRALTKALMERRIAGAGLDVFEREPISDDDPLLKLNNVVIVPHIGSASRDTREAMATMAAEGLLSYFEGSGEIKHLVNREVLQGNTPLLGRGKRCIAQ
jgi:glyoxylate reductase